MGNPAWLKASLSYGKLFEEKTQLEGQNVVKFYNNNNNSNGNT
jgi:hypothetical protein